jgi:hypothetical protein
MLRFIIFVLISFISFDFLSQENPVFTTEEYKDYWFDKSGKPLFNKQNLQNGTNQSVQQRGVNSTPNPNPSNQPDPKNNVNNQEITLNKISYNSERKFKVANWLDKEKKDFKIEKQVHKIVFTISEDDFEVLQTSPLVFEFVLDQRIKNALFEKFVIQITKEKHEIKTELSYVKTDGEKDIAGEYLISTDTKPKKVKYFLTFSMGFTQKDVRTPFDVRIESYVDNEPRDVSSILHKVFLADKNEIAQLDISKTKINEIIVKYEGDKKDVKPITVKIEDESTYKNLQPTKSKRKAIIIANSYENNKNISSLGSHPLKDGRDVSNMLQSASRMDLWQIDTNFNMSKNELRKKFMESSYLDGYDTLFIYYAGHGVSTNIVKDGNENWVDYWVPSDINIDINQFLSKKDSLKPNQLDPILSQLYSINEVLSDIYRCYSKIYPAEMIRDRVKVMVLSDACREDISQHRGMKEKQLNSPKEIGFDYMVFPVVAEGKFTDNANSWTQKYLINYNQEFYKNNPFAGLPKEGYSVKPWFDYPSNNYGPKLEPFMSIFLLK